MLTFFLQELSGEWMTLHFDGNCIMTSETPEEVFFFFSKKKRFTLFVIKKIYSFPKVFFQLQLQMKNNSVLMLHHKEFEEAYVFKSISLAEKKKPEEEEEEEEVMGWQDMETQTVTKKSGGKKNQHINKKMYKSYLKFFFSLKENAMASKMVQTPFNWKTKISRETQTVNVLHPLKEENSRGGKK